jgi:hypothetical protein
VGVVQVIGNIAMRQGKGLILWEAAMTFATSVAASLGLVDLLTRKETALIVIMVQALNGATVVFKTGQWNPPAGTTLISTPPK